MRDFTRSSDREIVETLKNEGKLCGRFLPSQLDRKLYIPKEKNTIWIKAGIVAVNVLGLFSYKAFAQAPQKKHPVHIKAISENTPDEIQIAGHRTIEGLIANAHDSLPAEGITIINRNTLGAARADRNGKFSIEAAIGDPIEIFGKGYETETIIFNGDNLSIVALKKEKPQCLVVGGAVAISVIIHKSEPPRRFFNSVIDWLR